jgi:hypothetical protein
MICCSLTRERNGFPFRQTLRLLPRENRQVGSLRSHADFVRWRQALWAMPERDPPLWGVARRSEALAERSKNRDLIK